MSKRKPLMPGDRVRCRREDGNPCPGHVVQTAHFYGSTTVTVAVYPPRCGMTGPSNDCVELFRRLPKRAAR